VAAGVISINAFLLHRILFAVRRWRRATDHSGEIALCRSFLKCGGREMMAVALELWDAGG
jgi:hypothetical protein